MNNTQKTIALMQDMSGLLTDIQPLLTDGKVHDLRVAAAVRLIRKEAGELLEDLTNEQKIIEGYREGAIDAIDGLNILLVNPAITAAWSDAEMQRAMLCMTLAVVRFRKYFRAKQAAKEAPICEAG